VDAAPLPFPVSGAILAGGRSSRMGRNKAFLPCPPDGTPLIVRQANLLRSLGISDLLISGRAGIDYAIRDARIVIDSVPDAGPLAGLAAVFTAARHSWVLVIAVDMPRLTTSYLQKLLTTGAGRIGVIPQGSQGYEPLVALYPRSLLSEIESALDKGDSLSLQNLIHTGMTRLLLSPLPILPSEADVFTNWNTQNDIASS
jgi:molybdopterin-guanine dinucleotide biosynthesis protein A